MTEKVLALARPGPAPNVIESKLLGAVLDLPDPISSFEIAGMPDGDFSDSRVAVAWRIAKHLAETGRQVNCATVFSFGRTASLLGDADNAWLEGIQAGNVLTRETFGQVAGDLRRAVLGRLVASRLEAAARELRSGNFVSSRIASDLDSASDSLIRSDIHGETAASDVLELVSKWEERERTGKSPMMLTRIKLLDDALGGGAPPKLTVMAGQPGVGKNMVLAGMIRAQLEADESLNLGLFALEDGSRWLLKRWVAQEMGIPLPSVGIVRRTPEQMTKLEQLEPYFFKLLERVHVYRYRKIKAHELLHVSRGWIHNKGVAGIYVDNLTHLDHRPPEQAQGRKSFFSEKRNEAVASAIESFAELADRKEIPIIALAHTVRPESEKNDERPPRIHEVAESAGIERTVRCFLGLWRTKSRELRITIGKNTEGPGVGTTIELERITEAATIEPSGGHLVNLDQEAREERENRETLKDERTEARRKKKAEKKAQDKAAADAKAKKEEPEPKKEAPQLTLIEGGGEKPPEGPKA